MDTLFPYQADGVDWLAPRSAALLADEPGLGKTAQAVRAADRIGALRVLVVCPATLVENWRREILTWRQGDWTAFITSYDKARGKHFKAIMAETWCVGIFDEAHYLKSGEAKRTTAIYGDHDPVNPVPGLAQRCDHVWSLTGTPMPNDPGELYSHLRALAPERIKSPKTGVPWSFYQFQHHFCQMKPGFQGPVVVGSKNEDRLNTILDGFMLRRLKRDVLPDLPPIQFSPFYVDAKIDEKQLGFSPKDIGDIAAAIEEHGIEGLKKRFVHLAQLRRATALAKLAPAIDYIRHWLESTDRKLVVFAHHKDIIRSIFHATGITGCAVRIDGTTMPDERKRAVDRFQNDPITRVFIGQITAAGTGITLTAASDMLFVESSWTPADNAQAAMRIHRIGQKDGCNVKFMMISGSIDEAVQRAVMRKTSSIAKVLGDEPKGEVA